MRLGLLALALLLPSALAAQTAESLHLIPIPRDVRPGAPVTLALGVRIDCQAPCSADDSFAIADLTATLAARHIAVVTNPLATHIFVARMDTKLGQQTYAESLPAGSPAATAMPAEMQPEGYVLIPDRNGDRVGGLAVTASTSAGIFYALQTVKQLIVGDGPAAHLNAATIRDWPAMKWRGLHDDLSRGPVDTLDFQKKLIRTLAAYKVNIYSPYFETTQFFPSNPLAAVPGAAMSQQDAMQLVAYAAQYHITIVPEQEAFGHLRHLLTWETYAGAAETPHGAVLAPSEPQSMQIIDGMFKDLTQMYPGPFVHVGADETFDLGTGKTRPDTDARGLNAVYLDYLQRIVTDLQPLHKKVLFWGDIAQKAPDLLKAMPQSFKDQTIVVQWGYSPQPKNFDHFLTPYADAGFQIWVAPSINNYRQVFPNQQEALLDIQQFTRDGQKFGAQGQLNTLWHDDGESLANMDWYGVLFGAAAAWQQGESSIPAFQASYGLQFHGDASGLIDQAENEITAAMALMHDAKVSTGGEGSDGVFWLDPWSKDGQAMAVKIRPIDSELRLHAESAINLIGKARVQNPNLRESEALDAIDFGARRIDFLGLMFQLSDEMIHSYAQAQATLAAGTWKKASPGVASLLGDLNNVANGRLQDMTYGYSQMRQMYQEQWLRTYRPANLQPVLERYDFTIQRWIARVDQVRAVQHQWAEQHTLPDPSQFGMPAPLTPVAPSPVPPPLPNGR
ncbi:Glycosyl hydrolase family 20, domain 2 [Bryocella elongata]|uniref:beta-N-acetylhexosaminidase n=1 Tax=Bryocella elongata TaxID=863522 RepID=A0A1H5SGQ2_9BACT|nr:family 20 glycosylhydrolase [Bryocella elongata]SEF49655.1 Glycosyl hydrolase family 20, domain 2 [Bryocella elongata]